MTTGDDDQGAAIEPYGAAPERTALALQRTGLGVVVGAFLIFRSALELGVLPIGLLAVALGLLLSVLAVFGLPGRRRDRAATRGTTAGPWTLLVTLTSTVVALGALAAAVGVIGMLN